MKKKTILITGGAGFIGSYVNALLHRSGYDTVVFDNLSQGCRSSVQEGIFVKGDIGHPEELKDVFTRFHIDAVMHFAALINVGESCANPDLYYKNNVANTLTLLESMLRHSVKTLIFSSSAAIFGLPQTAFIKENHPVQPINPYGETKLMVERILRDFDKAYNFKFAALRYFNAAGGDPEGKIKHSKNHPSNLIPIVLSQIQRDGAVTIFGTDYPTPDGTCIRDYIHIHDLGTAHVKALERLLAGGESDYYNLGNGKGFSVREVIAAAKKVTGRPLQVIEGARRLGDPPFLLSDAEKARRDLGWTIRYPDLESMIKHAWGSLNQ